MFLEGRSAGCCSATYVLKVNGRPIGKYEGRWFSECLDLALTGRRQLEFRKVGWLASEFELIDVHADEVVASCRRSGIFTTSWDVTLSIGAAQLVSIGWLNTAYELWMGQESVARVDRLGMCERGWIVDASGELAEEDMLLIGLVYHTIIQRQQQQQQAGGAAAAGT
jgi:hypothetical protein